MLSDGRLETGFLRIPTDEVGVAFLLLTALLWGVAGAFALRYHRDDPHRSWFFSFFLLTLAGNLGVVLAGDLLTFYFAFAVMTFSAYGLVVHSRTGSAFRAGRVYVVMAVVGEAVFLSGILALGAQVEAGLGFQEGVAQAWAGLSPEWPERLSLGAVLGSAPAVTLLFLVGLGVKAGLVPLHIWLPLAHPVAPAAASALLSGAMIKAGVLGWVRVLPQGLALPEVGAGLLVMGTVTAFYGVVVGLAQDDAKTVLAYSSISQMGYMALPLGALLLEPSLAPLALGAVGVYAVHHAMAKGALFLSAGVAGRGDPGWVRDRLIPVTALPALALAGAPLTSGALAKGTLKGVLGQLGGGWYPILGPLLLLAAAGTTLLMVRFLILLGPLAREGRGGEEGPPPGLLVPWGLLVVVSALLPVWLPLALPGLGGEPGWGALPAAGAGWLELLGPVLLGGVVGMGVAMWAGSGGRGRRGALAGWRIPPGDLLVLLERAHQRHRLASAVSFQGVASGAERGWAGARRWLDGWVDRMESEAPALTRGPVLGGLILLLLLSLVATLLGGLANTGIYK